MLLEFTNKARSYSFGVGLQQLSRGLSPQPISAEGIVAESEVPGSGRDLVYFPPVANLGLLGWEEFESRRVLVKSEVVKLLERGGFQAIFHYSHKGFVHTQSQEGWKAQRSIKSWSKDKIHLNTPDGRNTKNP